MERYMGEASSPSDVTDDFGGPGGGFGDFVVGGNRPGDPVAIPGIGAIVAVDGQSPSKKQKVLG